MVEYIDELDRAKHVIQQLPKETPINQERLARQIGHREREAYLNLNIPGGKRRNHMPAVPEKSQRLRDYEYHRLILFVLSPSKSSNAVCMRLSSSSF